MLWILYLVTWLFHYLFFQGFSLAISIKSSSSSSSLCLNFSASMNLGETFTYQSWRGVLRRGHSCTDCMCPTPLMGELDWHGHKSCLSWECTVNSHLGTWWGWRWRGYSWSLLWGGSSPLLSGCPSPVGMGSDPKLPEQKPWAQTGSVPFKSVFSSFSALGPFPQSRGLTKQVGLMRALGSWQPQTEVWAVSEELPLQELLFVSLPLLRCNFGCNSLCPY